MRITSKVVDDFLQHARARAAGQPISELVSEVTGGDLAPRLSRNQRASRAWFMANGDLERGHTCGVYLRDSRVSRADPVLGVYVDSSARVVDFRANKDLYLARLANAGLRVSDIDFRLSRRPNASRQDGQGSLARQTSAPPLPALSPEEERRLQGLVDELPPGLRPAALRAVNLSLRREKLKKTNPGT